MSAAVVYCCSDCGVVAADSILLGVGYQGGVVKVYSLTTRVHWTNQFTIVASLATELHRETGGCVMEWVWSPHVCVSAGMITGLLMVAHADGCMIHVCYNSKYSCPSSFLPLPPLPLPLSCLQTPSCTSTL